MQIDHDAGMKAFLSSPCLPRLRLRQHAHAFCISSRRLRHLRLRHLHLRLRQRRVFCVFPYHAFALLAVQKKCATAFAAAHSSCLRFREIREVILEERIDGTAHHVEQDTQGDYARNNQDGDNRTPDLPVVLLARDDGNHQSADSA